MEVAELNGMIAMRDSDGQTLHYTTDEFRYLIREIKDGGYDFGR